VVEESCAIACCSKVRVPSAAFFGSNHLIATVMGRAVHHIRWANAVDVVDTHLAAGVAEHAFVAVLDRMERPRAFRDGLESSNPPLTGGSTCRSIGSTIANPRHPRIDG
jgi:hypothetical protein